MTSELILRDIALGDLARLVRLARLAADAHWTREFVHWKYFQNPTGRIRGCCAELDDRLLGFYGNAPVRIKLDEDVVLGAQALDAMVLPEARRQGLFASMAQRTYRCIDRNGVKPLYGIPNPISRAGMVKRLGWSYPGEIPAFTKLVDPCAIAARSGLKRPAASAYWVVLSAVHLTHPAEPAPEEGICVREVSRFDGRFNRLWEKASGAFHIAVVRDVAYLNWRYVQNPLRRYLILVAERGDRLLGYTVLSFRDAEHKGILAVAELLLAPNETSAGLALLREVTGRAVQSGCSQVQCWMLPQHGFYTDLLRRSGFVHASLGLLPGIFRQTTSFITRMPADCAMTPDPTRLENWFITMGDQDYY